MHHLQKIKYEYREELEILKGMTLESADYKQQKKVVESLAQKIVSYTASLYRK